MGTVWFPKANERFFCHVKEDRALGGDVLSYAEQGDLKVDLWACGRPTQAGAEIAKKRPFLDGN